ncbi:MAG: hypothetical protein BWK80_12595 [Desulfobacteraceae bacterium IS3]|nr:MAG: hypothetical protein BWK80_12595 [Desulfobacteraceae bacterium IS3]
MAFRPEALNGAAENLTLSAVETNGSASLQKQILRFAQNDGDGTHTKSLSDSYETADTLRFVRPTGFQTAFKQ